MKKMLLGIMMLGLLTTTACADTPTHIEDENCVMTVTGQPTLDGWWMALHQEPGEELGIGWHESNLTGTLIELSGTEMIFNLTDMGFNCDSGLVGNDEVSFDTVKSLYR